MPLHLLGKKSWNVYNADNIARVKADEAAAAAREAANEQRMQELDAARRAAILRGHTPPPLPEESESKDSTSRRARNKNEHGSDRKRRKLAGEDDTDMDIRLARVTTGAGDDARDDAKVLKIRSTAHDAPLTDHAGNIDLFPVDMKETIKREKNAEAEKEKRRKEQSFEDQYTMRFSNAAGREGLSKPWYAAEQTPQTQQDSGPAVYSGFESKDVWGNEEPRRREREQARITSNDPFAFMQKAQVQLKQSKEDKKKWAAERDRELRDLRATQEREDSKSRHHKRRRKDVEDIARRHSHDESRKHKHHHRNRSRSRSRSRERHAKDISSRPMEEYEGRKRDRSRSHRDRHSSRRRPEVYRDRDDGDKESGRLIHEGRRDGFM